MSTLLQAQATFRQSPTWATALAYMDAAIAEWEKVAYTDFNWEAHTDPMRAACAEVRAWLSVPQVSLV